MAEARADSQQTIATAPAPSGGAAVARPGSESDASAMADALLAELESKEAKVQDAADSAAAADAALGEQVDQLIEQVRQGDEPAVIAPDVGKERLADELQQMLDEAKAAARESPGEKQEVAQIDVELAAHADETLAGEFDTVTDVLAEGTGNEVKSAVNSPSTAAAHAPQASAAVESSQDTDELRGTFQSPEDVAAGVAPFEDAAKPRPDAEPQPAAGDFSADAADVALELDADQAHVATPAQPVEKPKRRPMAALSRPFLFLLNQSILRRVCYVLNLALRPLAPTARDMVGYAGLITLFNGLVLCGFGLARKFLGT